MPLFALFYPCMMLAASIDPLALAQAQSGRLTRAEVEKQIVSQISELLAPLIRTHGSPSARPDQRWYWAAPLLLDQSEVPVVRSWMVEESDAWSWKGELNASLNALSRVISELPSD